LHALAVYIPESNLEPSLLKGDGSTSVTFDQSSISSPVQIYEIPDNKNNDIIYTSPIAESPLDQLPNLKGWISKRIRNIKKQKYHHRAAPFNSMEHCNFTRESIDDILHYSRYAEVVYNSDDASILYKNNILRMNTNNGIYQSPYIITYDSDYDTIVLAIRGTWSIHDILTDLNLQEEEFQVEGLEGEICFAHRGNVPNVQSHYLTHSCRNTFNCQKYC
jgi:hypothetical protein